MPKVSIVIPIYNVIEYLPQTVRSACAQTEPDIEIILVDDGSADGSGMLCDELALKDERIRVIHKKNGGLSSARNAGIAAAKGEFVLLLDGDDRLHRQAVSRTLSVMKQTNVDFVQFRYREVTIDAEPLPEPADSGCIKAEGGAELFSNLYRLGGEGASACTKLYRRELLIRIPFENIRHEDEQWCTRAFQEPLTAAYVDDVLYDYVTRDGSIIRGSFHPSRLDALRVSAARLDALKKLDLTELLSREYSKLFLAMLTIYKDAANAGDRSSMSAVQAAFETHKEGIRTYGELSRKFNFLFRFMCVRFEAAELYRFYWKIRR